MKNTEICSSANSSKKSIGNLGEEKALMFLRLKGYKIICRNYSVHNVGEIDIIAKDKNTLCFVEVRLRSRSSFGTPAETISAAKRNRLIRTAQAYIASNDIGDSQLRFDVVEVFGSKITSKINLIKDAFWLN